jgi:3-deoxy-D-manno-octulosonic-acid transferase
MYLVYSMAFTATFVAMLPYFIYKAIRHGKYADSLKERLGFLGWSTGSHSRVIWVHAVSVGEFLAAEPLIQRIIRELPGHSVVVSTTTLPGQKLARDRMVKCARGPDAIEWASPDGKQARSELEGDCRGVFYFPFDWRFAIKRTLDQIRPVAVIIMETEIWPNFLDECRRRGIATVIANGRLSERSHSRYRLARRFIRRVLRSVTMLLMQTQADQERVILLGASPDRVSVCGNLKYDAVELPATSAARPGVAPEKESGSGYENPLITDKLDRLFALGESPRIIVAGSTAEGEEEILLAALQRVISRPGLEDTRLILAPRRPERFDEVARIIADSGAALDGGWVRRSQVGVGAESHNPVEDQSTARVILLDSIGELARIYRFASIVFVGGSLVPRGGHNIIEPAAFAKPILVGPYTYNFMQVIKDFADAGALVRIDARDRTAQVEALSSECVRLLTDSRAAAAVGARARKILESNRGATERTMTALRSTIEQGLR